MKGRGQVYLAHTERTDRFRYEQDFKEELEAFEGARIRSLGTNRYIRVMKNEDGSFTIQSHGVDLKGQVLVATFHRGAKI